MRQIELAPRSIIFAISFVFVWLLGLGLLWMFKELLISLFIAFILKSAIKPMVDRLEKKKIPRLIATVLIFAVLIGFFVGFGGFLFPPLLRETAIFLGSIPELLSKEAASGRPGLLTPLLQMSSSILSPSSFTSNILQFAGGIFNNFIYIISILFFSFYFVIDKNPLPAFVMATLGKKHSAFILRVISLIEKRMSAWLWAELLLMFLIGLITYIGLTAIQIPYALPLAFLAGILEIVPILGPVFAALPAILVALATSTPLAGVVILLYIVIQQVENTVIVPMVMRKTTGIHPVLTLVALSIGGKFGGGEWYVYCYSDRAHGRNNFWGD
ncbi:MAG: pheromone autoinducer 2 transporter [Microgenomates bacterium OLB22]|nr:MAG: pheromone autoinducer 2 transporter [Microgenomates bacterium OLB22]